MEKIEIKQALRRLLGERITASLRTLVRGKSAAFSEAELIRRYFVAQPRSGVIVDVGAHYGGSFKPYLAMDWKVYAFEPDPANRKILERGCDTKRIRLFDCAVSNAESQQAAFFASEESSGISTLSPFRPTHREAAKVNVTTLAQIIDQERIEAIDFLKIDTEGHDLFVLQGFPWESFKPEVVLCEFEDRKTEPLGYAHTDLGNLLVAKGYSVLISEWAPIVRYGVQHEWRSIRCYPAELADSNGWGNFIAFRDGIPEEILKIVS